MDIIYNDFNILLKDKSLKQCFKSKKNELNTLLLVKNYNNLIGLLNFLKNDLTNFIESYLPKISYEYKNTKKLVSKLVNKIKQFIDLNTPKVIKKENFKKSVPQNSKNKHKIISGSGKFLAKSKKVKK